MKGGGGTSVLFLSVCPSELEPRGLLRRHEQAGRPEELLGDEVTRGHHRSRSQAQSMRSSIVSFQMTIDCTGPDDAGETDGERLPGGTPTEKERVVVVIVVVESPREKNHGT